MRNRHKLTIAGMLLVLAVGWFLGCGQSDARDKEVRLSVTVASSLLESAVRELVAGVEGARIVCIVEPGSCPGHFDMTPRNLEQVLNSDLFVLYDFQSYLKDRMPVGKSGPRIVSVTAPKGLCIPEGYRDTVREMASVLKEVLPDERTRFEENSKAIAQRVRDLAEDLRGLVKKSGMAATPVLCSAQQEEFCRWLGLEVVASFARPDDLSAQDFERLAKVGKERRVCAVIGNLQEGTAASERLAELLGVSAVTFSNFPAMTPEEPDFETMIRHNVTALLTSLSGKDVR